MPDHSTIAIIIWSRFMVKHCFFTVMTFMMSKTVYLNSRHVSAHGVPSVK